MAKNLVNIIKQNSFGHLETVQPVQPLFFMRHDLDSNMREILSKKYISRARKMHCCIIYRAQRVSQQKNDYNTTLHATYQMFILTSGKVVMMYM